MSVAPEFQSSSHQNYGMAVAGIGEGHDFGIYPQPTGAVSARLIPEQGVVAISVAENVSYPDTSHTRFMARKTNQVFGAQYNEVLSSGVPALYAASTAARLTGEYMKDYREPGDGTLRISLAALCMGPAGEQVLVQAGHTRICGVQMSSTDPFKGLRRLTPAQPALPFFAQGNSEVFTDELPASSQFKRFVLSTQDVTIEHESRLRLHNISPGGLHRAARHLSPNMAASHLYVQAGGLIVANNRGAVAVADVISQ